MGFALPVDMVRGIVDQIIQFGKVTRPFLGVSLAPDSMLRQMGLKGVLVLTVPKGGPASAAGIQGTYRDDEGSLARRACFSGRDAAAFHACSTGWPLPTHNHSQSLLNRSVRRSLGT